MNVINQPLLFWRYCCLRREIASGQQKTPRETGGCLVPESHKATNPVLDLISRCQILCKVVKVRGYLVADLTGALHVIEVLRYGFLSWYFSQRPIFFARPRLVAPWFSIPAAYFWFHISLPCYTQACIHKPLTWTISSHYYACRGYPRYNSPRSREAIHVSYHQVSVTRADKWRGGCGETISSYCFQPSHPGLPWGHGWLALAVFSSYPCQSSIPKPPYLRYIGEGRFDPYKVRFKNPGMAW